ncbi:MULTISPECIES: glucoamylase family protein [Rhodanobacter]|uniref:glucoamylase family protein n=1 Tax=Rhodanobacter TaxID=75309 RepID=UPI00041D42B9|nr:MULTISPECIES: glucoamylase family protein [Rhodanobacter]TAN14668.1 MAG: Tat pathway signal protein [Rhodanobacter sp.]UJJ55281.1 Tat pathway signal protein [Rhodanobacter thiooxydans]
MSRSFRILRAIALTALLAFGAGWQTPATARQPNLGYADLPARQQALVDDLQRRSFDWFWQSGNPQNGLLPDSWPGQSFSSIAAVGFGLTAYGIGVERHYITRQQAVERTLATLRFFADAPQNGSEDDASGYHGFFYHFLDMHSGKRFARWTELSSVDTTLLLGGVLFAQSYYDRDTPQEAEIRQLADTIYRRVDWPWMQPRKPLISMGWTPGGQFIPSDWKGYNEGMLVYLLALGSPTHPVGPEAWTAWLSTNHLTWGSFQGQTFLNFAPMFGHQYSQSWVDFRGIRDAWSREHGLDYFENSRRATYAQRSYAIANPGHWTGYGANVWGLTASNGPGGLVVKSAEGERTFHGYTARGVGLDDISDDGTIAPTAAAGSIAFAPELVIPALATMQQRYGKYIYNQYGFVDAFNLSFHTPTTLRTGKLVPGVGWVDTLQLGIDQGPIVLMIENWRNGFVWKVMKKNPYIRKGLERAGFEGGWLGAGAAEK